MNIHSASGCVSLAMVFCQMNMTSTLGSSIRFLKKVCQLVRCTASPKQPQSEIGLKSARYNVSGVKNPTSTSATQAISLNLRRNSKATPVMNSTTDRAMPSTNAASDKKGR